MGKKITAAEARAISAEEHLLIDAQFVITDWMLTRGMNEVDLAKAAGVSVEWLKDFQAAEADPTLKQVARLFHVLGRRLIIKTATAIGDPA